MSQTNSDTSKIILRGRLSFPNLFKPRANENDEGEQTEPKYGCAILLDKEQDKASLDEAKKIISRVAAEAWPGKEVKLKTGQKLTSGNEKVMLLGICLRDGTEKDDKEGYGDGMMFVSASSKRKPEVVQKVNGKIVPLAEDSGKPYAGCYVAASVRFWAQDNKFGKRINAELRAVCFLKDGDAFGSAPVNVEEEFGDVEDSEASSKETPTAEEGW